ncbi:GxxExxY protein [Geothrix sp. PMB-07]|uniref:GxxExxY protein n=1 Tax=Geothrix sp. PMB-07 TaxID=3068640 RepID=UPI0027410FCB|nr:GxxExxY protein [Geothrix sp. PMB-07]WLT30387.1 GxxExxY protein [Geothrix sp. PMB-07]
MEAKDPETFAIIGAATEVHRVLGCGFAESAYQEALAHEFRLRGIPFEREALLPIEYKGEKLNTAYRADFICFNRVIVELKALVRLGPIEDAQLLNYLKVSGRPVGLLLNFGTRSLETKRMVGASNTQTQSESVKSVESVD